MGRISFQRSGQRGRGRRHQADAGQGEQPQQHEVGQDLVARGLVEHAVGRQERGPVGRLGVRPDGVRHFVERRGPEDARPVRVRVDVMADHLALRGVGVDVATEEGRRQPAAARPRRRRRAPPAARESPRAGAGSAAVPSRPGSRGSVHRRRGRATRSSGATHWCRSTRTGRRACRRTMRRAGASRTTDPPMSDPRTTAARAQQAEQRRAHQADRRAIPPSTGLSVRVRRSSAAASCAGLRRRARGHELHGWGSFVTNLQPGWCRSADRHETAVILSQLESD